MIKVLSGDELESVRPALRGNGFSLDERSIVFAEYDESGELMCVLPVQQLLFVEGVVSLSKKSDIRKLWNSMEAWLKEHCDLKGKSLLAIPSNDKVASACEALGCVDTGQRVYRRDF